MLYLKQYWILKNLIIMPSKLDKKAIKDPFLDKRRKLIPCQEEMVKYWFERGNSITSIAKMFKVNKRLIQFLIFPERKVKNIEDRRIRGGSNIYYNKDEHTISMKKHRDYKKEIFKNE